MSSLLLNPGQIRELERLVRDLSPEQALWLSGYLAAVGATRNLLAAPATTAAPATGAAPAPATAAKDDGETELTVLYGTETGNARGIARTLVERAAGAGLSARAVDMAQYRTRRLRRETKLALITATHGEGDPPDGALEFFEFVQSRKARRFDDLRFAVLSLGDSSYVEFCKAGRDLDARFEELGGRRVADRVDCDLDYEGAAEEWIDRVIEAFRDPVSSKPEEAAPGVVEAGLARLGNGAPARAGSSTPPAHSRRDPCRAEILDILPLTGLHSDKETLHVELAVEEKAFEFRPGDSLGIVPRNEDAVVEGVLDVLRAAPDTPVRVGSRELPLAEALTEELELTLLTPAFLRGWAELAEASALSDLLDGDDRGALRHYMQCRQVPDVLREHPAPGLEPQELVSILRGLEPRLYSIASSPCWIPDQIDLTVAVTRYTPDGKARNGVTTTYLADRRRPGEHLEVFLDRNDSFRLPADPDAPLIMIGAGAGVAPFRAFLQDRQERGARGRSWLFFGDRRFREDFLYQTEWQRFLADGVMTRMDVAFSRDQPQRVYVQDRLRERGAEVFGWLEEGAHLYVCGDARGMAPGVEEALRDIFVREGARSPEAAADELRRLRTEGRYRRDVY